MSSGGAESGVRHAPQGRHEGGHMGQVSLHGGLVQLVQSGPVQLLPQVEALPLLSLLPQPLVFSPHLQQVLVVGIVVRLSLTIGPLLLVHAGEAVSLGPELEVHTTLQVQAAVRLSERVPGEGWMRQALSSSQRAHPHEGGHTRSIQDVQTAHLRHCAHGEGQGVCHGNTMQSWCRDVTAPW